MSGFSQIIAGARAPGKTIVLEPWVFADEWEDRPSGNVCVGIRLISEADKSKARAVSNEVADSLHSAHKEWSRDNWIDAFNDAIIRQIAAFGICDPNNVRQPSTILPLAEEQVRFALTSAGAKHIFEQIERYEIESSSIDPEIREDELDDFASLLQTDFDRLLPQHKRLLAHVREFLGTV